MAASHERLERLVVGPDVAAARRGQRLPRRRRDKLSAAAAPAGLRAWASGAAGGQGAVGGVADGWPAAAEGHASGLLVLLKHLLRRLRPGLALLLLHLATLLLRGLLLLSLLGCILASSSASFSAISFMRRVLRLLRAKDLATDGPLGSWPPCLLATAFCGVLRCHDVLHHRVLDWRAAPPSSVLSRLHCSMVIQGQFGLSHANPGGSYLAAAGECAWCTKNVPIHVGWLTIYTTRATAGSTLPSAVDGPDPCTMLQPPQTPPADDQRCRPFAVPPARCAASAQ